MAASQIKKALTKKKIATESSPLTLSTGSTMFNLALSGSATAGLTAGKYYFFVGDTSSGKTFLTLTCLAEASINPAFDHYRFIYDDVEGGALMDFAKFFGKAAAERIEPPAREKNGTPIFSDTIEDFYFHLDDALNKERPCIYILDSMDALSSDYELRKFDEKKEAARKGTRAKGDYGDGKAKINSSGLRSRLADLRDTQSILIIINQTRDKIDAGLFESKKTRSGGHALSFYATAEIWTSIKQRIKRQILGKPRTMGVVSSVRIKKNRINGRDRTVEVPIYYSVGIDDVGSCVEYLIAEAVWKVQAKKLTCTGIGPKFTATSVAAAIAEIEKRGLESELRELVQSRWLDVEAKCEVRRKARY